jgi:putative ABC transport system permease protein
MTGSRTLDINLIGVRAGAFTRPPTVEGRPPSTDRDATVERSTGVRVGARVNIGGRTFRVVGRTAGLRYRAAVPTSYVTLSDAQTIGYTGRQLASTVVTQGTPSGPALPAGLIQLTGRQVRHDLLDPLRNPRKTIAFVEVLLWVVAAMIVGSILYVSTLDRARDFAVLKAVGASSRSLFVGLAAQALVLCTVAYVVAAGLSRVIGGASPMPSEIPSSAYLLLAVVAVVVAFVASAGGLRRTTRIDPALAFGAV